jgi:hypothetical protein
MATMNCSSNYSFMKCVYIKHEMYECAYECIMVPKVVLPKYETTDHINMYIETARDCSMLLLLLLLL